VKVLEAKQEEVEAFFSFPMTIDLLSKLSKLMSFKF
jgi:hypothetical protein